MIGTFLAKYLQKPLKRNIYFSWCLLQMRGERKLLERLLQTEIAMLRAIRDGSALMQHMEDFYYIALLEVNHPSPFTFHCFVALFKRLCSKVALVFAMTIILDKLSLFCSVTENVLLSQLLKLCCL